MLHNIKSLVIKSKAGKKMMAAAMTAALVMGAAVLPGEIVQIGRASCRERVWLKV